jgi:hypothetical protein
MRKRNLERMRYKTDSLASGLCILSIVFDVWYFITLYSNNTVVPDRWMGVDILINILYLLAAFLASEEAKVYAKEWAYVMFGLGAAQLARAFWLPEVYRELEQLTGGAYQTARFTMLLSAALMLLAGLVCWRNSTALRKFLAESGKQNG